MLVRVPDYFDQFACLAGDCPHSCCIGWEVVIDEDTARRYRAEPGPLGEKLRAAMQFDGEDVCFPLDGGPLPISESGKPLRDPLHVGSGSHLCHLSGTSPLYRGIRPV